MLMMMMMLMMMILMMMVRDIEGSCLVTFCGLKVDNDNE